MKVLRIIARLNVGGPARHVVWLTRGLKDMGCDTLLVAGVVPSGEEDMSYFAEAAGVEPFIIREMSREVSLKDSLTTWRLFRLMLRERPDIVHTHTAKAGTVGRVAGLMYRFATPTILLGRPRRCLFVHTYHGHVFHSYYSPLKTRAFLNIERLLARLATHRIIVVSRQQQREINENFQVGRREQFSVVPLGIDLSAYENWQARRPRLRAELKASEAHVLVGIVGRLTEIKNHAMFLQAAARLKELMSWNVAARRVRFVIVGDGNLRGKLESQAASLGLGEDVLFLGTRADPEDFYPAFDILALTSLNEGTPLTLIEGMANSRPVIATAVGGVVDLVGAPVSEMDGYAVCERGLLVKSKDIEGFARGLARLIEDEALRRELGKRGREFVLQHHSKERLVSDIAGLYQELTGIETVAVVSPVARATRP